MSNEAWKPGGFRALNQLKYKTKEEAVAFAKKYLSDRKVDSFIWALATEYVLLDIIPHLYGEALD